MNRFDFPGDEGKVGVVNTYLPAQLPILVCDLSAIGERMRLAREAIDELRVSHPESPVSNVVATYMSPWKSHLINPKFAPLCESVVTIAKMMAKDVMSADLDALNMGLVVTDCWGIIYDTGSRTGVHNHFPSDFACSVYLEADPDCAPIVFGDGIAIQPRANTMLLFPGILNHSVPENQGRRVVVSMNLNKRAMFERLEMPPSP